MKQVIWRGSSRSRIRAFPVVAQDIAEHELMRVQFGKMPADWRAMPSVGTGVIEIRIHRPREYRVVYVANYPEAIYVLHCFEKKMRQTALKEIQLARMEYAELQRYRQKQINKTSR